MGDARLTPKPVLPGEMYDVEEMDRALREADEPREPPAGSWAATARMMASLDPDFDWDSWKDEMKERDL